MDESAARRFRLEDAVAIRDEPGSGCQPVEIHMRVVPMHDRGGHALAQRPEPPDERHRIQLAIGLMGKVGADDAGAKESAGTQKSARHGLRVRQLITGIDPAATRSELAAQGIDRQGRGVQTAGRGQGNSLPKCRCMVCPEPLRFKAGAQRLRLRLPDPLDAASDVHTDTRPGLLRFL